MNYKMLIKNSIATLITPIIIFSLLTNCNSEKNRNSISNLSSPDTISPVVDYSFNTDCANQFTGYFFKFGYYISNYYTVCDYQTFGEDSIAVLSPKLLTPEASICRDQKEKLKNGRILVVKTSGLKTYYRNVIENEIGSGTCGGELIRMDTSCFVLYKQVGQGCKFSYEIEVKPYKGELYITGIRLERNCPLDAIPMKALIEFEIPDFNLSKYYPDYIDSLRTTYGFQP